MAQERSKRARTFAAGERQPADRDGSTKKALDRLLVILAIRRLRRRMAPCQSKDRTE